MLAALMANPAAAHCDSMSGPVVKDAQTALVNEKIDPVLKWVGEDNKAAIRDALEMALAVRMESALHGHVGNCTDTVAPCCLLFEIQPAGTCRIGTPNPMTQSPVGTPLNSV